MVSGGGGGGVVQKVVILPGREEAEASLLIAKKEIRQVPQPPKWSHEGYQNRSNRLQATIQQKAFNRRVVHRDPVSCVRRANSTREVDRGADREVQTGRPEREAPGSPKQSGR